MKIRIEGNLTPWALVGEPTVRVESRFGTVREEKWENPVSGAVYTFPTQIEIGNYLSIMPFTKDGNLVLTNQWKQGVRMLCPQFPGGALPPGQNLDAAAREKLLEETGYQVGSLEIEPTPLYFFDSRCPNWYRVIIALQCEYVGRPASTGSSVLQIVEVTLAEFWKMVDDGEIHEPATYVAAIFALRRGYLTP